MALSLSAVLDHRKVSAVPCGSPSLERLQVAGSGACQIGSGAWTEKVQIQCTACESMFDGSVKCPNSSQVKCLHKYIDHE